jgi:hypothetical protein
MAVVTALGLSGCLSLKSYVDPNFGRATYEDIRRPAEPYKLKVVTQLLRNGKEIKSGVRELQPRVERVLRDSGVGVPVKEGESGELRIVLNNIGDTKEAAEKGFATGFTLGLSGTLVTDYYEMDGELRMGEKTFRKQGYKHALHSTIGNKEGPPGLQPMKLMEGFDKVLEQLVLNLLADAQKDGFLTRAPSSVPSAALEREMLSPELAWF